ncbi:phosphate ABC transporter permease PstA [Amygdalobacter indicium]|uniref:Phosphate transport system permease protein PstA n=1 Tax=Amygdalobacter indicium TaxID=3029272 RepID=A0ABY8C4N2_9FIRM|nr:phosphate ABC transporter permease PstA [Amygdalobacter indicium]WEG34081.1 phosphate ABC transporter permease PstA [Amygdalobacter indicium]WEG35652.1 phosphate ABC transporter permease PstA [Amygdalobacter indicium]
MTALNGRKQKDYLLRILVYLCAAFTVFLLAGIILYVFWRGSKTVTWEFLTGVKSVLTGKVGIAGNIVNTCLIIILTMVIAVPLGIGSAIYLNEYAERGKVVALIEFATETLAGIPSIIFGLFGMLFFGEKLGLGYSLLTGALTLILMILPLLTRNTQEALKAVPAMYRSAAIALGSGKWHMIRTVLLPAALPGILTGIILAVGRIIGESAALLFTAGSAKFLPKNLAALLHKPWQSGGTLTIQMYLSATAEGDFTTAFGIAAVLLCLSLASNLLIKILLKHLISKRKV